MISIMIAALAVQTAEANSAPSYAEALAAGKEVIGRVKTSLTVADQHLTGCSITASSRNASIDQYVCDATRYCFDQQPRDSNKRQQCVDAKLDELAKRIAVAASTQRKSGTTQ